MRPAGTVRGTLGGGEMNDNQSRPSAKELGELSAYLAARERGVQPAPGAPGFPGGLAGALLKLAESTEPDPDFVTRLERELRQAARTGVHASRTSWLSALWQSFSLPERKIAMKRL